jgi:hypothetical protein
VLLTTAWNRDSSSPVHPLLSLLQTAARARLLWGASAGRSIVHCLLRLPSIGGRSYGELDLLYEHTVSARRFARAKADRACQCLFEVRGARTQLTSAQTSSCTGPGSSAGAETSRRVHSISSERRSACAAASLWRPSCMTMHWRSPSSDRCTPTHRILAFCGLLGVAVSASAGRAPLGVHAAYTYLISAHQAGDAVLALNNIQCSQPLRQRGASCLLPSAHSLAPPTRIRISTYFPRLQPWLTRTQAPMVLTKSFLVCLPRSTYLAREMHRRKGKPTSSSIASTISPTESL